MKKIALIVSFMLVGMLLSTTSYAQYESGGFGGFHFQLMNFGDAGFGVVNGGIGGAVFAGSGFIGGFGYGGVSNNRNNTVALGYGGILGGAQVEIGANQKIAPGARLGFGGYSNVVEVDDTKIISSGNMMRIEPNVLYNYEAFPKFNIQIQAGYSFNLVGNLRKYNTAFLSIGVVLGTF